MFTPTSANHTQTSNRLRSAFDGLTVTQRQAVYLNVVEGWPIGYVAYQLGLPKDATERIASAARTKLYQAVAQ